MPPPEDSFRSRCIALEWKQGSAIHSDAVHSVLGASCDRHPDDLPKGSRLVLVTQTCDLVQVLRNEPWAEAILLKPIEKFNRGQHTSCLHGRNPRRLIFATQEDGTEKWWEASAHDRFRFDKNELLKSQPDEALSLSAENTARITRWLARRYIRPALPDQFVKRTDQKKEEFSELFKGEGFQHITGIFLDGVEGELDAGESYRIKVLLCYRDGLEGSPELFEKVHAASTTFEELLGGCGGLDLVDCRLDPEQDITLRELRVCKRWDLDYRSQEEDSTTPHEVDPL